LKKHAVIHRFAYTRTEFVDVAAVDVAAGSVEWSIAKTKPFFGGLDREGRSSGPAASQIHWLKLIGRKRGGRVGFDAA